MKTIRFNCVMKQETKDKLMTLAQMENRSQSNMVEHIISLYYNMYVKNKQDERTGR